ncbi:hypothetical protein JHK82_033299 [Glycine max]|nr:hypothetical protein JHK82_033299 [Glycine max]KAG5139871.1 hypothetical protein JHK84_033639 [Glycine max]
MSGHRLHRALSKLKLIEEENDQRSQDARGIHRRHIHRRSRRHLRLLRRAKAQAVKVLAVLFTLRTETKVRVQARLSGQLLLSVQSSQQRRYIPHSFLGLVTEKPKENMKVHAEFRGFLTENALNSHPYEAEITALLKNPLPKIELGTEIADLEMKDSYVWVHTELNELIDVLSEERFFAVDTEQHSLRSFLGFTTLVQISTREKDYLVDTIALHDFMGILRPVFANPSICKACEVMSKPQKSLAYLLETYCGVTTNKLLQNADSEYFEATVLVERSDDQAIVALASQPSVSHSEIYSTIAQADINMEMGVNSLIPSLSPVICSHLSDIYHLLANKLDNDDDIYSVILQKCLGQNGSCPLSIFNYALLVNSNLRPTLGYKQPGPKNPKQYSRKASRDLFVQKFSCKSAVYHNCRIYANDGRLLCYCDRRKLEWYLNRDLAKLIDEEPPAIMLLFEPKGRPEDEGNDFYIQIAHAAAEKYKRKVAVEFGIPLYLQRVVHPGQKTEKQIEERAVYPLQLQTAAMALLRHGPRMPLNRHEELTEIINRHYGGREISDEDLERALQVGMTPHERRRFKKKRGTATVTKQDNHAGCTTRMNDLDVDTLKVDAHDGSYGNEKTSEVDRELLMRKDDFENSTLASDIKVNGVVSATPNRNMITVETTYYNGSSDSAVNVDDSCLNSRQENGLGEHNSKLSLLGHGPHGKQVVEDLLKEYGEDGIQAFCQRWHPSVSSKKEDTKSTHS